MEAPGVSRRRLLSFVGCGLALTAMPATVLRAAVLASGLHTAKCTGRALGAEVTLTVLHQDEKLAQAAGTAALAELQRIDSLLSIYRSHSQVALLNREGKLANPHPDLIEVLQRAQRISQQSHGAFDVTVQPLWKLFSEAKAAGGLPDAAAIAAAQAKVDYRKLRISAERLEFAESSMALTLNGIAQGFATDRATEILRSHGIQHALINAGEISAIGQNASGTNWTAGIQHPRREDAFVALAKLEGRCLATSGDYATSFSADHLHNHIFDPATGDSPRELASVSIAAPSAMLADALSTAVFVLGSERGIQMLQHYDKVDVLLVRKDGTQVLTGNFPRA